MKAKSSFKKKSGVMNMRKQAIRKGVGDFIRCEWVINGNSRDFDDTDKAIDFMRDYLIERISDADDEQISQVLGIPMGDVESFRNYRIDHYAYQMASDMQFNGSQSEVESINEDTHEISIGGSVLNTDEEDMFGEISYYNIYQDTDMDKSKIGKKSVKKQRMNKMLFLSDSEFLKEQMGDLYDILVEVDDLYEDLVEVYNDSNWSAEESDRYEKLTESINVLKGNIWATQKCAELYQVCLTQLYTRLYSNVNKSKSPSLSKSYTIKGHEGTFKAIAKCGEYSLMQSVRHGNKAYNVILKGNKIFADRVNGINDMRWKNITKSRK